MFYPREQRPLGEFVSGTLAKPAQESAPKESPLLRDVRRGEREAIGDVPLDPMADAFLLEHRLRGKPLLPVVVGLEALAEIAALAGNGNVTGFRNVQMVDGLLFHSDRAVMAQARATAGDDGTLACELTCDFRNRNGGLIQKNRPYLRATAELTAAASLGSQLPPAPTTWTDFSYPEDAPVYHGAVFRGVNGVSLDGAGGWGRIRRCR